MKNGAAMPLSTSAIITSGMGTSPSAAVSAYEAAVSTAPASIQWLGRRVRSRITPTSGAASTLGPRVAATSCPPSARSSSSVAARIGSATMTPEVARRNGTEATR